MGQEHPHWVVVGGGISGLSAAWHLRGRGKVTLLEADHRLGGHTHTRSITIDGITAPVDTASLFLITRPTLSCLPGSTPYWCQPIRPRCPFRSRHRRVALSGPAIASRGSLPSRATCCDQHFGACSQTSCGLTDGHRETCGRSRRVRSRPAVSGPTFRRAATAGPLKRAISCPWPGPSGLVQPTRCGPFHSRVSLGFASTTGCCKSPIGLNGSVCSVEATNTSISSLRAVLRTSSP